MTCLWSLICSLVILCTVKCDSHFQIISTKERMNLILKHDPVWLGLLRKPDDSPTLILIGDDGHQVAVPAPLLLAVSPLMRSILTDLLPPDYCPCFVSLPATEEVLQVVRDILTTGTVVVDHVNEIEEVRQVLGMLGVEALIVSYQLESIQVGQVFERDIKEEHSTDIQDIRHLASLEGQWKFFTLSISRIY